MKSADGWSLTWPILEMGLVTRLGSFTEGNKQQEAKLFEWRHTHTDTRNVTGKSRVRHGFQTGYKKTRMDLNSLVLALKSQVGTSQSLIRKG